MKPIHFLRVSWTYAEHKGGGRVRSRRDLVARELKGDYTIRQGDTDRIVAVLHQKDFPKANRSQVRTDAAVMRNAFKYATASEAKQAEIRASVEANVTQTGRIPGVLFGVWCLIQDGIKTQDDSTIWDQILERWDQYEREHPPEQPEEVIAEVQGAHGEESGGTEQPDEAEAGKDGETLDDAEAKESPKEPINLAGAGRQVVALLQQAADAGSLLVGNLLNQIVELEQQNSSLNTEMVSLQEENARLNLRLQNTAGASATDAILQVAPLLGDQTLVARMITRLQQHQQQTQAEAAVRELLDLLPKKAKNGDRVPLAISYAPSFLEDFRKCTDDDQTEVLETLETLCEHGLSYPSLRADTYETSIHGVPAGCTEIHIKQTMWRIYLKTEKGVMHIHRLIHKRKQ